MYRGAFPMMFSPSSDFSFSDFWGTFKLNDVLKMANTWQVPVPSVSYSFDLSKGSISNTFNFTPTEFSDNLQTYVSDLTGISLSNTPYTFNTPISSSGTAPSTVTTLTTTDLNQVNYSGDIKIDALIDNNVNWNYLTPSRSILYYSFDIKNFNDSKNHTTVSAFNAAQQDAARAELKYVTSILGIKFVEVSTTKEADIHFSNTNLEGKSTAGLCDNSYSYNYNEKNMVTNYTGEAYVYLDNVEWNKENSAPTAGSQGYETLLHEIGHALGLKHPFETPKTLPRADDNTNNTIMSYTHKGVYKTEFQSYDLAALKWLYGTDGLTEVQAKVTAGDDFLVGTAKADSIEGLAGNDTLDGGIGSDTLTGGGGNDLYIVDNVKDKIIEISSQLDVDTVQSGVNFSLPKYVENLMLTGNAVVGTGNESANHLVGNDLANTLNGMNGNDTLEGGKGNDKLTGGQGEDTFVFNLKDYDFVGDFAVRAANVDTVTDFVKGTDHIQLSATFAFKGFAVVANMQQAIKDASLIYDNATRALYFDADGSEAHYTPTAFIKLSGKMNLDQNDLELIA